MHRKWTMPAIGSAAGFVLGAIQVVRENAATWGAVHATPATIMLQTVAGALLGAAFIGAATAYLFMRRGPAKAAAAARPLRTTRAGPEIPREGARYGARQAFIMIFALALLALGSLVLVACVRHPTVYGLLRGGFGAVFLLGLGGYLLWDDFVAPNLGGVKR